MFFTIPTLLTWARIIAIPLVVGVFYLPLDAPTRNFLATAMFIACALTDWLDGWLARRYGMTTAFGAFLDPVADKLTVTVVLFLIVQQNPTPFMAILGAIIVGREISITALREWMATIGQSRRLRVATLGKFKTIVQMVALACLLYSVTPASAPQTEIWMGALVFHIGDWLLAIAALLTLWSAFVYVRAAWPHMREEEAAAVEAGEGLAGTGVHLRGRPGP